MTGRDGTSPATPWRPRGVAYLLVALLLLSLFALAYSAWRFERNLAAVREAEGDNRAWNVSQLEVDYQDFLIAIQDARETYRTADPALVAQADAAVRLEFDIFYSRISAFNATLQRAEIDDVSQDSLNQLMEFRNGIAGRIDTMSPGDADALEAIQTEVAAAEAGIRHLTVSTLQALVARAEAARLEEKRLLRSFLQQSVFLLLLTLLAAGLALRLVGLIRRQARETLRAQALINKAFEGAQEGVLVCDAQGRILLSNPTAREIFGRGKGELEGRLLSETVVPFNRMRRFRTGMEALLREVGASGSAGLGPIRFEGRRADDSVFAASVALRAEDMADGDLRIFVFVRDISDVIESGERLREALREAREHSAAKGRFLATMSHEMRTPLHGVAASLDLLHSEALDAESVALLATARSCSERALAQIDYALDAIRSKDEHEPPSRFEPAAAVRSIIAEMEPLARIKGNEIDLDATGLDGRISLVGLPKAYSRTVFNLVGNAVKFTTDGQITIRLDLPATDDDRKRVLLTEVRDNGPGIAKEDRERIFAPFEQGDATGRLTGNPGFGLGLSIVKQDVARMGGEIEVDSVRGGGACLRFTVPLVAAENPPPELPDPADVAPAEFLFHPGRANALVVDDNPVNCALVARMLERLGFDTECCHSGAEAVDMARSRSYQLVLMDLRMPGMDGAEASDLIRRAGASRRALIVGITAQVDFANSEAFQTSGMTSVLTKPFGKADLARHLAEQQALSAREIPTPAAIDTEGQAARDRVLGALRDAFDLIGEDIGLELAADMCAGTRAAIAAARRGDVTTAEKAHSAAGPALMMGLTDLGRLLQRLESLSEAEGAADREEIDTVLAALSREITDVESALEALHGDHGALVSPRGKRGASAASG